MEHNSFYSFGRLHVWTTTVQLLSFLCWQQKCCHCFNCLLEVRVLSLPHKKCDSHPKSLTRTRKVRLVQYSTVHYSTVQYSAGPHETCGTPPIQLSTHKKTYFNPSHIKIRPTVQKLHFMHYSTVQHSTGALQWPGCGMWGIKKVVDINRHSMVVVSDPNKPPELSQAQT